MEKMIAFCGLICTECPAFIATQNNDEEGRIKVADTWSKQFNMEIKPENVICDGCLAFDKRLCGYCRICEIRKCALEKKVQNCAYCNEYMCEGISEFFNYAPEAKQVLEEIKNSF